MRPVLAALMLLILESAPADAYDRREWKHWAAVGLWRTDDGKDCRADVRDAAIKRQARYASLTIVLGPDGRCVVDAEVLDFYGATGLIPKGMPKHVDHVWSLAYVARRGGDAWSPEKKAAYANDLTYRFHLIVTTPHANVQKLDKGPHLWVPENLAFWCSFGEALATIAMRWDFIPDPADRAAVVLLTDQC